MSPSSSRAVAEALPMRRVPTYEEALEAVRRIHYECHWNDAYQTHFEEEEAAEILLAFVGSFLPAFPEGDRPAPAARPLPARARPGSLRPRAARTTPRDGDS